MKTFTAINGDQIFYNEKIVEVHRKNGTIETTILKPKKVYSDEDYKDDETIHSNDNIILNPIEKQSDFNSIPSLNYKDFYGVIYKIDIGEKCYVGKTKTYDKRIYSHKNKSKRSKELMYEDIRIIGIENCKFSILEYCKTKEELHNAELYYIKKHNSIENGYNKVKPKKSKKLSDKQELQRQKMIIKAKEFFDKHGYYQFQKVNKS